MQVSKNILLTENQKRIVVMLMLLLLSSVRVFGQTEKVTTFDENQKNTETVKQDKNEIAASDSDIDFMNWFMGSRQAQSASSSEKNSSLNTKKQLINSGGSTNRVLYKTLVKKVISIDNALV